jgi:hypothetical protein
MKTKNAFVLIVVVLVIAFLVWWAMGSNNTETNNTVTPPPSEQASSIAGCYAATNGQDTFTLNIQNQTGDNVTGTLAFKNFEKDSSSGTFSGTYKDGILLADYTFNSEGSTSVRQVIFKKVGDDFVEGFGPLNSDGTRFTDTSKVTYDNTVLSTFKAGACIS